LKIFENMPEVLMVKAEAEESNEKLEQEYEVLKEISETDKSCECVEKCEDCKCETKQITFYVTLFFSSGKECNWVYTIEKNKDKAIRHELHKLTEWFVSSRLFGHKFEYEGQTMVFNKQLIEYLIIVEKETEVL